MTQKNKDDLNNSSNNKNHLESLIKEALNKPVRQNPADYVGNIPVSSVGILIDDIPQVNCARVSLLKMVGIYSELDFKGKLTTTQGSAIEEKFNNLLLKSGEKFTSEEVVKFNVGEHTVSGRADFVLENYLVELKTICSDGTAKTVYGGKPINKHVIQASIYAKHLNKPALLTYWNSNHFPDFTVKGEKIKRKPAITSFNVVWVNDRLVVDGQATYITKKGIEGFVLMVEEAYKTKELPPKAGNVNIYGETEYFTPCSNCEYAEQCKNSATYEEFVGSCRSKTYGG